MKKYNAFTLAEVLVTLIIIGIIAAITVPSIKKVSEERTYIASVKKVYQAISVAVKNAKQEEGPIKTWSDEDQLNFIKNRLNVAGPITEEYEIKQLGGLTTAYGKHFYNYGGFILSDGTYLLITNKWSPGGGKSAKFTIFVDINGKNSPNIAGVDVHTFWIAPDGSVYPGGGGPDVKYASACTSKSSGWTCTAKLLEDGKFSW